MGYATPAMNLHPPPPESSVRPGGASERPLVTPDERIAAPVHGQRVN